MPTDFQPSASFAHDLDRADPLSAFRAEFEIPSAAAIASLGNTSAPTANAVEGPSSIYLCGNSLGCMPRRTRDLLAQELTDWGSIGVEGHLHATRPWLPYHEQLRGPLSRLVGAHEREVVAMNTLTVNLHLMMLSFYRPTRERYRIVIEDSAFPSDSYAVMSQARFHAKSVGFNADTAIIRLKPRDGEETLRTQDILDLLAREGSTIALVMIGGVNYLTGQWFDMPTITAAGHAQGCVVGWDLAHAAGSVPVKLHDWNVDFAVWCSYKYLNAGPGAVAGAFVHERHLADKSLPRLAGWWGNDPATRFAMGPDFVPVERADAWAMSNPPIFSMTPLIASLDLFDRAGIDHLRAKSLKLTSYMAWLIDQHNLARLPAANQANHIRIITPREDAHRGGHLSLAVPGGGKAMLAKLRDAGVVVDFREPNVVRAAPTAMYNTFTEVHRFVNLLSTLTA